MLQLLGLASVSLSSSYILHDAKYLCKTIYIPAQIAGWFRAIGVFSLVLCNVSLFYTLTEKHNMFSYSSLLRVILLEVQWGV